MRAEYNGSKIELIPENQDEYMFAKHIAETIHKHDTIEVRLTEPGEPLKPKQPPPGAPPEQQDSFFTGRVPPPAARFMVTALEEEPGDETETGATSRRNGQSGTTPRGESVESRIDRIVEERIAALDLPDDPAQRVVELDELCDELALDGIRELRSGTLKGLVEGGVSLKCSARVLRQLIELRGKAATVPNHAKPGRQRQPSASGIHLPLPPLLALVPALKGALQLLAVALFALPAERAAGADVVASASCRILIDVAEGHPPLRVADRRIADLGLHPHGVEPLVRVGGIRRPVEVDVEHDVVRSADLQPVHRLLVTDTPRTLRRDRAGWGDPSLQALEDHVLVGRNRDLATDDEAEEPLVLVAARGVVQPELAEVGPAQLRHREPSGSEVLLRDGSELAGAGGHPQGCDDQEDSDCCECSCDEDQRYLRLVNPAHIPLWAWLITFIGIGIAIVVVGFLIDFLSRF